MSSYLYRLGLAVSAHAKRVLAVWLVVLLGAGTLAVGLGGQLQDNLSIPGTESQRGIDTLDHRFPELAGTSAQVLFVAPEGSRIKSYDGQVHDVLAKVKRVDHVQIVTDPFQDRDKKFSLSHDGRDALAQVQLDVPLDKLDPKTVDDLEQATQAGDDAKIDVHLGGAIFTNKSTPVSPTESIGVLVALAVLVLTFGSLLAAGIPIITAMLGVGVSMSGVLAIAAFTDVNSSTPTLALMIGLAVGIDYALFIVSRHRGQLVRDMDVTESIARSVATAGSAVIFAGTTVVIALCGLVVANIPFLAVMGLAGAAAVAVAVVVALTVVPALLAVAGERLRPKPGSRAARNADVEPGDTHTLGARWVRVVTKAPAVTVALVVGVLVLMAIPAKDLALGLPDNGTAEPGSTERTTYDLVSRDFGPGYNTPLLVTVDIIRTRQPIAVMRHLGHDLEKLDGVHGVALTTPNRSADLGIVQIIPDHGQTDPSTAALVNQIRDKRPVLEQKYDVTDLEVTGQTAVTIDVSDRLSGALLPFSLVVVGFSLLLLTLLFRSIAVPIKATLGYLLSVAASFGAVAMVFEWGWLADAMNVTKVGPVMSFLPIVLMGVLFGLAMDYEVFLVSRMREEYVHSGGGRDAARRAIASGFTAGARVVTAAAVIMISVFAAFVPEGDAAVKPMAFGLAVGVFVDAFLVRMTLVPAVMALLGERAWWLPKSLERRLPRLDVEGTGLDDHLEHEAWTREHGTAVVRAADVTLPRELGSFAGVDLVAGPGDLVVVASDDRAARRGLLAALTGRLDVPGRLVVLDRVLPDEAGAVRRQVALLERFPTRRRLTGLRNARLVVVDDVDALASEDEVAHRWQALAELTDNGVTVVAGVRSPAAAPMDVTTLELFPVTQAEEASL
jgi:putative drug exporter of the RND superfamily